MNKLYILSLAFILVMISCKRDEAKTTLKKVQTHALNNDSLIIHEIMNNNLLFNKTYCLIDSIPEFLFIGADENLESHIDLVNELIKRDSIPNSKYKKDSDSSTNYWNSSKEYYLLKNSMFNKIFEDPFIIDGKVDNYIVIKGKTRNDGVIYASRIFYSDNTKGALIGVNILCGWQCGQGQVRYYAKVGEQWKLKMAYGIYEN